MGSIPIRSVLLVGKAVDTANKFLDVALLCCNLPENHTVGAECTGMRLQTLSADPPAVVSIARPMASAAFCAGTCEVDRQ